MARKVQQIIIVDYSGPQGSRELSTIEDVQVNRSKPRTKTKTMNRDRVPIAFQTGTEDVNVSLTVIPELVNPEVDWHKAWKEDEEFTLVVEKGINGTREQLVDCMVADINDSANENGDSRLEVTVEALVSRNEPG